MQIRLGPLPTVMLFNLFSYVRAANFTFQYGNPTSCGPFPISWSGGSPPFQLTLVPVFGSPRTVSVPGSSFSNGKGSFSTPLPFPVGQKFLASLSDVSGFASGGTTSVMSVGAALSGQTCNTTDPGVDFFFDLNTSLDQCRPYTISGYDGAVQPVTITGIIPGGSSFQLRPPTGPISFDWVANVKGGTSIIWLLTDSKGRTGGSSDIKVVGVSDDNTCLSTNSPASSAVFPSHTTPAPPSSTSGSTSSSSSSPTPVPATSGPNVGLIAGVSIAAVFAVIAAILGFLFWRRRNRKGRHGRRVDLMDPPPGPDDDHAVPPINPYPFTMSSHASSNTDTVAYGAHAPSASSHNLLSDHGSEADGALTNPYSGYSAASPTSSGVSPQSYRDDPSLYISGVSGSSSQPSRPYVPTNTTSSSGRSKAAQAGALPYKPARFILHTDLEEATPSDEGEEVIELPPQYSEARAPIPGLAPAPVPEIALTPATPSSPHPHQQLLR